jgi:D-arabinose 1-dehydrogenase-like Zn-dependent alcohol dehydrogenase
MPETGRIAEFHEPMKPFVIREVNVPDPEPGAVVIKITGSNICGSDLHAWHGDFATKGMGGQLPTVLGHEMIGRVAKLGEGVSIDSDGVPLNEGDLVAYTYFHMCGRCPNCIRGKRMSCYNLNMAMMSSSEVFPNFVGGYGDYYYIHPGAAIYKVPEDLPSELVAGANCALSQVIYGFHRADLRFGETVVIQGAGGLGLYATAVAKASGAHKVIVLDGVRDRLDLAAKFGADELIDITEVTEARDRQRLVRKMTGGHNADVVMEVVGQAGVIPEGINMLGQFGRYVEIGNISAGKTTDLDPTKLVFPNKTIIGVSLYEPWVLGQAIKFLQRSKDILPLNEIGSTKFKLEDINEAFAAADSREVIRASIVP